MERKRDGFVPLGDVVDGLSLPGGRALTHRAAAPLARHHFTTLQQVNQLVAASEADADLGFMARLAPRDAEAQIAAMRQDATAQVNEFRSTYPTRLQFPYALDDKAGRWPFLVQGMWHDGQFTYLRIDRPGDARALREHRRATVPYPVRPRSRRLVYRASPCRVRLAPNRPRTGRLESGPGRPGIRPCRTGPD